MTDHRSFFTFSNGIYTPTADAHSGWSDTMVNGPAIVGVLAQGLESRYGDHSFHPARLTVDLFAPVRRGPLRLGTREVRKGRRILVSDGELIQMDTDTVVARATLVQLLRGEQPPGELWRVDRALTPPGRNAADAQESLPPHLFNSDLSPDRWTADKGEHQNSSRKRSWRQPIDIIDGQTSTPFQKAAVMSEATSLITNWGSEGIGFINADITLALSRLPSGVDLGIEADQHMSQNGVGVGTATLFDRQGAFGVGTVVAVSNAKRQISYL